MRWQHIGLGRAPKRSSLSYANAHRPAALFEELFWHGAERLRRRQNIGQRKMKFRFKSKWLSLDSTTLSLCLPLFPWARFRRVKGAVKGKPAAEPRRLHALLCSAHGGPAT